MVQVPNPAGHPMSNVLCSNDHSLGAVLQIGLQSAERLANNAVTQVWPLNHYTVVGCIKGRAKVNENKCRTLSIVHCGFQGIYCT